MPDGADAWFSIPDGKGRASLGASDELLGLTIFDHDEKGRVGLGVGEDGDAALSITDRDETVRVALKVDPDGSPSLGLAGKGPNGSLMLGPIRTDWIGLGILDKNGDIRADLIVQKDSGASRLHFLDAGGKVIYTAPPPPPRRPGVGLLDERGEPDRAEE